MNYIEQLYTPKDIQLKFDTLNQKINGLKKEIKRLNHPDTFVLHSKAQRKLIKYEKEYNVLENELNQYKIHPAKKMMLNNIIQLSCSIILTYLYWDDVIITIKGFNIGIVFYQTICSSAIKTFTNKFF